MYGVRLAGILAGRSSNNLGHLLEHVRKTSSQYGASSFGCDLPNEACRCGMGYSSGSAAEEMQDGEVSKNTAQRPTEFIQPRGSSPQAIPLLDFGTRIIMITAIDQ